LVRLAQHAAQRRATSMALHGALANADEVIE
jgi:hypothetical protein